MLICINWDNIVVPVGIKTTTSSKKLAMQFPPLCVTVSRKNKLELVNLGISRSDL